MTSRERMKAILDFSVPDRVGIADAPWPETLRRWHREGLPEDKDASEYFGMDITHAVRVDLSFQLKPEVVEESSDWRLVRDGNGMLARYHRAESGTPELVDFLIKSRRDWEKYRERLVPNWDRINIGRWGEYVLGGPPLDGRKGNSFQEEYRSVRSGDSFLVFMIVEPYEATWPQVGPERLLPLMLEAPAWVREMFEAHTRLAIQTVELALAGGAHCDGVFLAGDIAYRNGMLFSPRVYRELLMPFHRELCSFFNAHGMPVIYHTDGALNEALPLLIEAGIRGIQPLEVKAGADVRELKKRYDGQVVFMGNIDVAALAGGKKAIEREVTSKVPVAMEGGGYIYHSDHSVPPDVSFDDYCYAMELVKRYGAY